MKKFKNIGKRTLKFEIGQRPGQLPTKYEVAPGEVCEIPAGYCQKATPGRKSFIERRGKGDLVPLEEAEKMEKKAPKKVEKKEAPKQEAPKKVEKKAEKKEKAPKKKTFSFKKKED